MINGEVYFLMGAFVRHDCRFQDPRIDLYFIFIQCKSPLDQDRFRFIRIIDFHNVVPAQRERHQLIRKRCAVMHIVGFCVEAGFYALETAACEAIDVIGLDQIWRVKPVEGAVPPAHFQPSVVLREIIEREI